MMTTLVDALRECLDHQPQLRTSAQQKLDQYQASPQYSLQLLEIISSSSSQPDQIRILASVNLKNYVDEAHWKMLGADQKKELTMKLIRILGDPLKAVRFNIVISSNQALTISKVAHIAWPEEYPDFIPELVICLRSPDINLISGATRVISDFVREDLSDMHFPQVALVILPELYRLFVGELGPAMRARIVATVGEFLEIIYMIGEPGTSSLYSYGTFFKSNFE